VTPFLVTSRLPAELPGRLQAVLAASGNAAEMLPGSLHATRLLAVGDATAHRARRAGFQDVRSAGGDAAALAQLAADVLDPAAGPLLLATGRRQGFALARDLRRLGFRVHRRAVYAARPVSRFPTLAADALQAGALQAALFFSAETAQAFARLVPDALHSTLARVNALAIGLTTADALRPLPWHDVRVALRPTQDGVLALI
jgi:uroporphyrinogen-III synthase